MLVDIADRSDVVLWLVDGLAAEVEKYGAVSVCLVAFVTDKVDNEIPVILEVLVAFTLDDAVGTMTDVNVEVDVTLRPVLVAFTCVGDDVSFEAVGVVVGCRLVGEVKEAVVE